MRENPSLSDNFSRHALLGTGIAILIWSGLEDSDAVIVAILGTCAAGALTLMLLAGIAPLRRFQFRNLVLSSALAGLLTGALAPVLTAALMLFKDLLHGHIYPDYPPEMALAMLERLPHWALAGGLAGAAIGIMLNLRASHRASHS